MVAAAPWFRYREPPLLFKLCMFLLGCMLYLILITLIFYRFTFVNVTTAQLTPPFRNGRTSLRKLQAGAAKISRAPASVVIATAPILIQ